MRRPAEPIRPQARAFECGPDVSFRLGGAGSSGPDVRALAEGLHVRHARDRCEKLGRRPRRVGDHFEDLPAQRVLEALGPIDRQHAPLVQQHDPRAPLGLVQVRRGHDDREATREELGQQLPELAARHGIDARGRLVEQEHLRLVDERAGQGELLLHATREPIGAPRAKRRQLGHVQETIARGLIAPDAVDFGEEPDVLVDREIAVEREPLRQVADIAGDGAVRSHGIVAEDRHAPSIRMQSGRTRGGSTSSCRPRRGRSCRTSPPARPRTTRRRAR